MKNSRLSFTCSDGTAYFCPSVTSLLGLECYITSCYKLIFT
uniref:Uncharacterized protein n=1 Tax=Arundo donax TaxID=35708 RepID=A0A0A9FZQ0_ARUDO